MLSASAALLDHDAPIADPDCFASAAARSSLVAWWGVVLLVLVAPFEALHPVVYLPGQSLSSVETVLVLVLAAWVVSVGLGRRRAASTVVRLLRSPLTGPWLAFIGIMLAAALAGVDRTNGLHMVGRFVLMFGVYLLAVDGVATVGRLRGVLAAATFSGALVAALAVLEYLDVGPVVRALTVFRPRLSVIGAQVRAGGPFQYPTIASMFLEIVFALALGLLLLTIDARRGRSARGRSVAVAGLALVVLLISEAVTLTFTRSGLITMAASIAILLLLRVWLSRVDRGTKVLVAVAALIAVQILTSRSFESLRLRLTTEGQETWYRARISAPARMSLQAGGLVPVKVTLTNTGRSTWDPGGAAPFRLSYHWLLPDQDLIVVWEGRRTLFPEAVPPGGRVTLDAQVQAPDQPGDFRLLWDVEQEKRLWFSGEPDADLPTTLATVRGPAVTGRPPAALRPLPLAVRRPGRGVLWRAALRMTAAHLVLGVGPDNYRLLYGRYVGLANFDSRVHSNNMYLEMLAGGGLLGGCVFVWFCWRAAQRVVRPVFRPGDPRVATMAAAIAAAAAAIALHGLVDSFLGFTGTYIAIGVVLGLAVAADALNEPEQVHAHRL